MASQRRLSHALRAGLAALLLAAVPGLAAAATPWEGFWWAVGGAYSSTKADCRDCDPALTEYVDTGTILARAGYTMSPRVRIGGELTRTERAKSGPNTDFTTLTAIAQWNMEKSIPVILEVGYGWSTAKYQITVDGNVIDQRRNGMALHFGVGSEWPVGPVAIGPYGAMYVGALGDIETPTAIARDALVLSWFAGLTITMP